MFFLHNIYLALVEENHEVDSLEEMSVTNTLGVNHTGI